MYGIEIKSIGAVPKDGMVPEKKSHPFSKAQVKDLKAIERNGGKAWGVVICGSIAIFFSPEAIDEDGRVNWYDQAEKKQVIKKSQGNWDLDHFFRS